MIGTKVVSQDGKTLTVTSTVTAGSGGTDIAVFDKQQVAEQSLKSFR
jgi:hypothetical protein